MKQVTAFQSEDGQVHKSRSACESADFLFAIRGFLNRAGIDLNGTTGKIVMAINSGMDEFSEIIRKRKAQLARDQKEHDANRQHISPSLLVGR